MEIDTILDEIFKLPEESKNALKQNITQIKYPKGHILLNAGKVESNIYFIKKGIVRAYVIRMIMRLRFGLERKVKP